MTVHGALLPSSLLHSDWFAVLAAFVAINTVAYVALAVAKMLPKIYVSDWIGGPERRSEQRTIYPEGFPQDARQQRGVTPPPPPG